jgi:hypothetical protein
VKAGSIDLDDFPAVNFERLSMALPERRTAMGFFARLFDLFWGWADYKPKDWSNAPYKRGYPPEIQNDELTVVAAEHASQSSPSVESENERYDLLR